MLSLRDLQQAMARGVLMDQPGMLADAVVEDGIAAGKRLQIYRNNSFISLTEALKATYPVVAMLVGERFFGFAAQSFIAAHPPTAPRLAEYGGSFGNFLAAFEPAKSLPYLADMARLEWAMNEAHHAPDSAALSPQDLAAVPPDSSAALRLALRGDCHLLRSNHRIDRLWKAHQAGGSVDDLEIIGDCHLLIYRPGNEVEMMTLDAAGYALLSKLQSGEPLGMALDAALAIDPGFDLAISLGIFLTRGVFESFSLPAAP